MSKKEMLINVRQSEETRIAILEDGVLEELCVERESHDSFVGNIYKGRIVNIEPSIQAVFVDFGVGRNGFLHISDVDPIYYVNGRKPTVEEILLGLRESEESGRGTGAATGDGERSRYRTSRRDRDRYGSRDYQNRDSDRDRDRERDRDRDSERDLERQSDQERDYDREESYDEGGDNYRDVNRGERGQVERSTSDRTMGERDTGSRGRDQAAEAPRGERDQSRDSSRRDEERRGRGRSRSRGRSRGRGRGEQDRDFEEGVPSSAANLPDLDDLHIEPQIHESVRPKQPAEPPAVTRRDFVYEPEEEDLSGFGAGLLADAELPPSFDTDPFAEQAMAETTADEADNLDEVDTEDFAAGLFEAAVEEIEAFGAGLLDADADLEADADWDQATRQQGPDQAAATPAAVPDTARPRFLDTTVSEEDTARVRAFLQADLADTPASIFSPWAQPSDEVRQDTDEAEVSDPTAAAATEADLTAASETEASAEDLPGLGSVAEFVSFPAMESTFAEPVERAGQDPTREDPLVDAEAAVMQDVGQPKLPEASIELLDSEPIPFPLPTTVDPITGLKAPSRSSADVDDLSLNEAADTSAETTSADASDAPEVMDLPPSGEDWNIAAAPEPVAEAPEDIPGEPFLDPPTIPPVPLAEMEGLPPDWSIPAAPVESPEEPNAADTASGDEGDDTGLANTETVESVEVAESPEPAESEEEPKTPKRRTRRTRSNKSDNKDSDGPKPKPQRGTSRKTEPSDEDGDEMPSLESMLSDSSTSSTPDDGNPPATQAENEATVDDSANESAPVPAEAAVTEGTDSTAAEGTDSAAPSAIPTTSASWDEPATSTANEPTVPFESAFYDTTDTMEPIGSEAESLLAPAAALPESPREAGTADATELGESSTLPVPGSEIHDDTDGNRDESDTDEWTVSTEEFVGFVVAAEEDADSLDAGSLNLHDLSPTPDFEASEQPRADWSESATSSLSGDLLGQAEDELAATLAARSDSDEDSVTVEDLEIEYMPALSWNEIDRENQAEQESDVDLSDSEAELAESTNQQSQDEAEVGDDEEDEAAIGKRGWSDRRSRRGKKDHRGRSGRRGFAAEEVDASASKSSEAEEAATAPETSTNLSAWSDDGDLTQLIGWDAPANEPEPEQPNDAASLEATSPVMPSSPTESRGESGERGRRDQRGARDFRGQERDRDRGRDRSRDRDRDRDRDREDRGDRVQTGTAANRSDRNDRGQSDRSSSERSNSDRSNSERSSSERSGSERSGDRRWGNQGDRSRGGNDYRSQEGRSQEGRSGDYRSQEYRGQEGRGNEYRSQEGRGQESRRQEGRAGDYRGQDYRGQDSRGQDSRGQDSRGQDSRGQDSRGYEDRDRRGNRQDAGRGDERSSYRRGQDIQTTTNRDNFDNGDDYEQEEFIDRSSFQEEPVSHYDRGRDDDSDLMDLEDGGETNDGSRGGRGRGERPRHRERGGHWIDPRRPRQRPPIQQVFQRGQEILVQVIKEGIGNKGPTLSTYLSLPGRYLVLMPGLNRVGVSRKIEDAEQRKQLREHVVGLPRPKNCGVIVRTAGIDRNRQDLERDLAYLSKLWDVMTKRVQMQRGPGVLYQESDMIIRTIRDLFAPDIDTIYIDEKQAFERAQEFLQVVMPRYASRLRQYENNVPLFHHFRIEDEISRIQDKMVPLPQGGSIVIEQTEALVAIDVNSGNFRAEDDAEETAFRMNMAAAKEIARQLRLRDLGGVIVNDFIDMKEERHRRAIENALRDAVARDRAKTKILRMSAFGIIEMTRQRIRPSLKGSLYCPCPTCRGTGVVKSAESVAIEVMRLLMYITQRVQVSRLELVLHAEVAEYLQNQKRRDLLRFEEETQVQLTVLSRPMITPEQFHLRCWDRNANMIDVSRFLPAGLNPRP